jgi:hypothetical protein
MLVLYHPFDHFAFFHLQSLCQGRGTNQVPLAVLAPTPDHLDRGLITHTPPPSDHGECIIVKTLVKNFFNFFTADHELALPTGMKMGDSPSRSTLTTVLSKSYSAFDGRIYFRESFIGLGLQIVSRPSPEDI